MIEAVLLYLVVMFAYVAIRPSLSYDSDGNLKEFGFGGGRGEGDGRTIFPLWIVAILIGVLVAFLYSLFGGLAVIDTPGIERPFRRISG
jgi:hypothetical protein